jgi:hypothetical protein
MWVKRLIQSVSFDSSFSSSVVVVVGDLRLLVKNSLSLGLGIGEPVSISC